MSFDYEIISAERLILVRCKGAFTFWDFISSTEELCADEDYVRGWDGLIDLRNVEVAITPEDVEHLAAFTLQRRKHGRGKWAVLVTAPTATALTMLFQKGVCQEHPFDIFSSMEAAARFLNRSEQFLQMKGRVREKC